MCTIFHVIPSQQRDPRSGDPRIEVDKRQAAKCSTVLLGSAYVQTIFSLTWLVVSPPTLQRSRYGGLIALRDAAGLHILVINLNMLLFMCAHTAGHDDTILAHQARHYAITLGSRIFAFQIRTLQNNILIPPSAKSALGTVSRGAWSHLTEYLWTVNTYTARWYHCQPSTLPIRQARR